MLKTWDFVDPKLLKKLQQTHTELEQLKKNRLTILSNNRISTTAKQKLLKYNDQCIKDLMPILNKYQEYMVEYFDTQLNITTKKQMQSISNSCTTINQPSIKQYHIQDTTKLSLDEDLNFHHSLSANLNTTQYYNICHSSDTQSKNKKISTLSNNEQFTTNRNQKSKDKQKKNFEFVKTLRNFTHTAQNKQLKNKQLQNNTEKHNTKNPTHKPKASQFNIYKKRVKRTIAIKQFTKQLNTIIINNITYQNQKLKQQTSQDKQLIQLLYKKISLLKIIYHQSIQQEKQKIQLQYKQTLEKVQNKYNKLIQIQQQNKLLQMKRKQILKL